MKRSAVLSDDGAYRYVLSRQWGDDSGVRGCFIMLNPSTADAEVDDPTIRRCVGFGKAAGWDAIDVVNLFAFRATMPSDLQTASNPVGISNDWHTMRTLKNAHLVCCAWGSNPMAELREERVLALIEMVDRNPVCLGVTRSGAPRHPLYLKTGTPFVEYPAAEMVTR